MIDDSRLGESLVNQLAGGSRPPDSRIVDHDDMAPAIRLA